MTSTCVVIGDGGRSEEVRDVLARWWAAGLLGEHVFVGLAEVPDRELSGVVATHPDGTDAPLREYLAGTEWERVHLLGVQLAGGPGAEVLERLRAAVLRNRGHGQAVELTCVVAPDRTSAPVPSDVLSVAADRNVLVSPEDRRSPRHQDGGVPPELLAEHAAHAVAGVGGMWVGASVAPLLGLGTPAADNEPGLVVVRALSRHCLADHVVDDVVAAVINRTGDAARFAMGDSHTLSPEPRLDVTAVRSSLVEKHAEALAFRAVPSPGMEPLRTIGPLEAFRRMFTHLFGALRALPRQAAQGLEDAVRRRIEDIAQQMTYGEDSIYQVSTTGRLRGQPSPDELAIDPEALANRVLEAVGIADTPPTPANLWRDLRSTAFALIDAGPLPSDVHEPRDGARRRIIDRPDLIAVDPTGEPFVVPGDRMPEAPPTGLVPPDDPGVARRVQAWLEHKIEEAAAASEETPSPETAPVDESADDATSLTDEQAEAEAAEGEVPTGEDAATYDGVLRGLRSYIGRREDVLVWSVLDVAAQSWHDAVGSLVRALEVVRGGPPSRERSDAIEADWRKYRLLMLLALTTLLGVTAGVATAGVLTLPLGGLSAVGVGVGLVGLTRNFMRYQRELFRLIHRRTRSLSEYEHAVRCLGNDAREVSRLGQLLRHGRDWSLVLGHLLHRPIRDESEGREVAVPEGDLRAAEIGLAHVDEARQRRLARVAGQQVLGPGWLAGLYEEVEGQAAEAWRFEHLDDEQQLPDPDIETKEPSFRRALREHVHSDAFDEHWRAGKYAEISGVLRLMGPDEVLTSVRIADEDLTPSSFFDDLLEPPAEGMLVDDLWSDRARVDRDNAIAEVRRIASAGVSEDADEPEGDGDDPSRFVFSVVRVERSAVVRPSLLPGAFEDPADDMPTVDDGDLLGGAPI